MRRIAQTYTAVLVSIAFMLGVLAIVDPGRIDPIEGAWYVDRVLLCDTPSCNNPQDIALPFITPFRYAGGTERHIMRFAVPAAPDGQVQALFIPKYSDALHITLNGAVIHADTDARRPWNAPLLVMVPPALLQADNQVVISLSGGVPGRLDLHPIHFGDHALLQGPYAQRHALGPGVTRFSFATMVLLSFGLLLIWANRRQDRQYLWIGLSCACAGIYLAQLSALVPLDGYRAWKLLQSALMAGYALFMLAFVRTHLALPALRSERVLAGLVAVGLLAIGVVPLHLVNMASMVANLASVWAAVVIVAVIWDQRRAMPVSDFAVFFPVLSLALAFASNGLLHNLSGAPPSSIHLLHLMPLLTSAVCLWLILSQLLRSLERHETLSATLQDRIAEKSRALKDSYDRLAHAQKEQTIADERARILLDLHDGVGGQLVNTLAYLEAQDATDPVLREALETALQDLALMLDSIENHDSLVTLLGMMRHRLEGLLQRHGLTFDWQIEAEPDWTGHDPSDALQVARIVQEAITNAVRHAQATTVTVQVTGTGVSVSDDGAGFDADGHSRSGARGYGLAGMQRRAAVCGADLTIRSGAGGTRVGLVLTPVRRPA